MIFITRTTKVDIEHGEFVYRVEIKDGEYTVRELTDTSEINEQDVITIREEKCYFGIVLTDGREGEQVTVFCDDDREPLNIELSTESGTETLL